MGTDIDEAAIAAALGRSPPCAGDAIADAWLTFSSTPMSSSTTSGVLDSLRRAATDCTTRSSPEPNSSLATSLPTWSAPFLRRFGRSRSIVLWRNAPAGSAARAAFVSPTPSSPRPRSNTSLVWPPGIVPTSNRSEASASEICSGTRVSNHFLSNDFT